MQVLGTLLAYDYGQEWYVLVAVMTMTLLLPYQHSHLLCLRCRRILCQRLWLELQWRLLKLCQVALRVCPRNPWQITSSMVPGAGVSLQSSNTLISFPGVSPGKVVDLWMKNYEQLRYLQQLYEDGILDQKEYMEQKQDILKFLEKL